MNSRNPVAPHYFINLFEQMIVVKQPEFEFIIVTLYNEGQIRSGEGHKLGIMRLLNKIDACLTNDVTSMDRIFAFFGETESIHQNDDMT
jgi:hypothetical protein